MKLHSDLEVRKQVQKCLGIMRCECQSIFTAYLTLRPFRPSLCPLTSEEKVNPSEASSLARIINAVSVPWATRAWQRQNNAVPSAGLKCQSGQRTKRENNIWVPPSPLTKNVQWRTLHFKGLVRLKDTSCVWGWREQHENLSESLMAEEGWPNKESMQQVTWWDYWWEVKCFNSWQNDGEQT